MKVDILTPDTNLFSGDAKAVQVPGVNGKFGILDNHAAMIATLQQGDVKVTKESGEEEIFNVKGGVVEVLKNKVIVLAE